MRILRLSWQCALLCWAASLSCISAATTTGPDHPTTIQLNFNHANDPLLQWCTPRADWQRPFLVALLADPQIGFNVNKYHSEELFRQAATHLERLQPDLILVAGDMIQSPMSDERYELTTAKDILEGLNLPYFLTSGNHDVKKKATLQRLDAFVEDWQTPHYWYAVEYSNTLFLLLETNILWEFNNDKSPLLQALAEDQLEWLETTLKEATGYDHIVPIGHHPMALRRINEDNNGISLPRKVRRSLRRLYESHPNVSHVFAGHIHNSAEVEEDGIHYIAYPATGVVLGSEDPGFALLEINGDAPLVAQYYGYDDLPTVRPDWPDATLEITWPNGGVPLVAGAPVCITWTSSKSRTNQVQVLYSLDMGATWTVIGQGPNVGVYPWVVPNERLSEEVLVAVASVYDIAIMGTSQAPNRIILVSDGASPPSTAATHTNEDHTWQYPYPKEVDSTTPPQMWANDTLYENWNFVGFNRPEVEEWEGSWSSSSGSRLWGWRSLLLVAAITMLVPISWQ